MAERPARAKSADTYEILVILFGALGLNRVYLRDWGNFLARTMAGLTALALLVVGLSFLEQRLLVGAGAFAALVMALWIHDYATLHRQVASFEIKRSRKPLTPVSVNPPA